MRRCKVFKTALKKEVKYKGFFHGFFPSGEGELSEAFEIEPVAVVETDTGDVREVPVRFFAFDKEATSWVALMSLPRYTTKSAKYTEVLN